jgi:hypothetical protein
MSAADKWLNNRPLFGHMITLLISMIVVFTTYALNSSDYKNNKLNERLEGKADVEYVDNKIIEHEAKEEQMIMPIKEDINELKAEDKLIRVEFLEEVRLLRKDIMDFYKSSQKGN